MPSRAAALFGNLGGGLSSRLSWMRPSYDFLTSSGSGDYVGTI